VPNVEVERRVVARARNATDLSKSSIISSIRRSCDSHDRSNRLLVAGAISFLE